MLHGSCNRNRMKYHIHPPGGVTPGERSIMRYTEYGLEIELEELRRMLDYAENRAQYGNMERRLYIKGGR